MLRTPRGAFIAAIVLFGLALFFALHPMFATARSARLESLLAQQPLPLNGFGSAVKNSLDEDQLFRVRDHWGFTYAASPKIDQAGFNRNRRREVIGLNEALTYLQQGDLPTAQVKLDEAYTNYYHGVDRDEIREDPLPNTQDELVLYGLYRYNRAFNYFQLTKNLRAEDARRLKLTRRALQDLRRTIGAFETLGSRDIFNNPYWGSSKAWQGVRLHKTGHGGFLIHHVYANLSTAYLRIGNSSGFPGVVKTYMQSEHEKYKDSGSELSSVVSSLTQSCTRGSCTRAKYRLTMALQNLEAASRGMSNHSESKFNYMIGLILCHLYPYDSDLGFGNAITFLELAIDTAKNPLAAPAQAARKELALIYLELDQDAELRTQLLELEPAPFRDLAQGPERNQNLLFTDMALYGYFARGELGRVFDHLQIRRSEFKTARIDKKVIEDHESLLQAEAEVFFASLEQRFKQLIDDGRVAEVGALLHQLDGDIKLTSDPILARAYTSHCRDLLATREQVKVSLQLVQKAWLNIIVTILPALLALLALALLARFYLSQRRMALGMLKSSYADDLGAS